MMTHLVEALHILGLQGEVELGGRWVKLAGERCPVYVIEGRSGTDYYTWCDDPEARTVEHYQDSIEAIQAGLRRAANPTQAESDEP